VADLIILAAMSRLSRWVFKTFGFAGGRVDVWEPEELYWGPEGTGWATSATAVSVS